MFTIDRSSSVPLYHQLYKQLLAQIRAGQLPAGSRLPGSRTLAASLGLGRNTVDNAYSQLAAEGYLQAAPGQGFRVMPLPQLLPDRQPAPEPAAPPLPPEPPVRYDLFYGSLSPRDFPFRPWRACLLAALAQEDQINHYPGHKGDLLLRTQLTKELFATRGIVCAPDQVIITSGLQGSLEILCKLLYPAGRGDVHAFEEPSYQKARFIFQRHGIPLVTMPLDASGAVPAALPNDGSVTSVYLTPSHQFPLGILMPVQRRMEFLNWAVQHDAYLIEDDYDSDYSYHTNPIPALGSIDTSGRTIYLGSFSKSLSPSMRMAYLVLPPALARAYDRDLAAYNCMVPWLMQRTLGQFMAQGHYQRLVRRLRTKFRRTHDLLQKELRSLSRTCRSSVRATP